MTPDGLTLSPEAASELIRAHFPTIAGRAGLLGTGWDNTVMLVDGEWAFRFPRRDEAMGCQERELAVLAHLHGRLPLPVPEARWVSPLPTGFPWPFWGGPVVPGRELCDAGLTDRTVVAAELGAFLRVLHACPAPALPHDPMGRGLPSHREPKTRDALEALSTWGAWEWDTATEALFEVGRPLEASPRTVLVHGDLHLRHVLVTADGHAGGVIDWGDACVADPSVDLSIAYAAFSGSAREAFFSSYGGIEPDQELRARNLALGLSAMLAVHALEVGNPALLTECVAGLHRSVAS